MRRGSRLRVLLLAWVLLVGLGACAGVPAESPVEVLREVGRDDVAPPPGPEDGAPSLDLVRDFVTASASAVDRHGAARLFLTPEAAAGWDDGASLTVLDGQIDTVPVATAGGSTDSATVRIRGNRVGRLSPSGAFEADGGAYSSDVELVQRDGQWRIARLPAGVVVGLADFRGSYRSVPVWFVDRARGLTVSDLRYLPGAPSQAQPASVVEMVIAGPSASLPSAVTLLGGAEPRANVAPGPDGVVVVDLTGIAPPDDGTRRLMAAQLIQSLAEVNVPRARILLDGEPLVADRPEWTRADAADLVAAPAVPDTAATIVTSGGRVGSLSGPVPAAPLPGPVGDGRVAAESAATSAGGTRVAVVARTGPTVGLFVGRTADGVVGPVAAVTAASLTVPTWTPAGDEVWSVVDGREVVRIREPPQGGTAVEAVDAALLTAIGPITDLRLSHDGVRLLAVVDGGLYVGAVLRSPGGVVSVGAVRQLRSTTLGPVVAAVWRSTDQVVAITRNPARPVAQVGVDGLGLSPVSVTNLTPPLTAVAAREDRPLLVTDQTGVWSFSWGAQDAWRQLLSGAAGAVPAYPG